MTAVVVGRVVVPCLLVIIHMQHHDALGRQESVPAGLDTVFQQIILIGVGIVGHLHGCAAVGVERCHAVVGVFLGINQVHPAHEMALIGSVTCRTVTVVQVAAVVHDVPVAHAVGITAVSGIEIGQAQAVTELVAEGAHAVNPCTGVVTAFQLVEHSKLVDGDPVELERAARAATP